MSAPVGHRTHLGPKGKGESSMFGKRMDREAVYRFGPQDPSDMAKAGLLQSQGPVSQKQLVGYNGWRPRSSLRYQA
jgi:hypothetical protein